MNSISLFRNTNLDFQPSNFEDACTRDDIHGILLPSTQHSLAKVSSWHSFPSAEPVHKQTTSTNASPSGTPQGSPYTHRKQLDTGVNSSDQMKKRWFNSNSLFVKSSDHGKSSATNASNCIDSANGYIRKTNSYKNVSNFELNFLQP